MYDLGYKIFMIGLALVAVSFIGIVVQLFVVGMVPSNLVVGIGGIGIASIFGAVIVNEV